MVTAQELTSIKGLGQAKAEHIIERFGENIEKVTTEELSSIDGVGPAVAEKVVEAIGQKVNGGTVKATTARATKRRKTTAKREQKVNKLALVGDTLVINGDKRFKLESRSLLLELFPQVRDGAQDYLDEIGLPVDRY